MYANLNNTKIFFDIDGAGYVPKDGGLTKKPVCFVLHGGPGESHGYFKPHLNDLTSTMQLIYIDNRGSGFSEAGPQYSYSMENNVEDIEALRKHLGLEKVWVLGHSYGGMVAMKYALKYQQNVEGLLLITTSSSHRFMDKAKLFVERHGSDEQKKMMNVLLNGEFKSIEHLEQYYEVMENLYTTSDNKTHIVKESVWKLNRSFKALNEAFGGFLKTYDITNQLSNIKVPSLVIGGRYDWITQIEDSEEISKKLPNSKLVIMEESSHSVMEEETEKFNRVIIDFVKKNTRIE